MLSSRSHEAEILQVYLTPAGKHLYRMTAGNRHCHAGKVLEVTIDLGQKESVLEETASAQTEALCGEFRCVALSSPAQAATTASLRALLRGTDSHSTGAQGK